MERLNKTVSLAEILSPPAKEITGDISPELTEEEIKEAIEKAAEKKRARFEYLSKLKAFEEQEKEIKRPWSTKEMLQYIEKRANANGIHFVMDENNENVVLALCRYFTNNPKFEQMGDGWSLSKGIALAGNIGVGKTTLMKLFNANQRACFKIVSTRKMADMFIDNGAEVLHTYSKLINVPSAIDTFFQNKIGLCFDDLGTERQGKRYGDSANVMEQIILNRYDNTDAAWYHTHITTNLTADEVEERYGSRVRSRMREMFNMITLPGSDRRK